jgi:RNA polymerase sigma-70 factor (ECF subfamily)
MELSEAAQRKETLLAWLEDHRGLISRVVRAWASSPHDRDDLVQEIGLQLWQSISSFKGESAVSTWVYRVTLYSAMAWSKRERRYRGSARELEESPASPDHEEDPRIEWLYAQIATLSELDRSLALLLLEGWSYREIADAVGISEKNVSVRIHRIKQTLGERSQRGDTN